MQNAECKMQNDPSPVADGDTFPKMGGLNEGEADTEARSDTKAHLTSSVPRSARPPAGCLTKGEIKELRSIFTKMDDTEIQRLYKRVTNSN